MADFDAPAIIDGERPVVVRVLEAVARAMELPMGYTDLLVEFEDRRLMRYGLTDRRNHALELHRYDAAAREELERL